MGLCYPLLRRVATSAQGHERRFRAIPAMSLSTPTAEVGEATRGRRSVPILLQKSLAFSVSSDSVALTRFAMEAVDDGAAQS
jgi:hypothetical protein